MDLSAEQAFIGELAAASGARIREVWQDDDLGLEYKADDTPVTRADRDAEALMRDMIHQRFPGHGIIAEEFGNEHEDAEFVWILDPIDGTKSFVAHVPLFGTLIGLLHRGEPVLGAIHQPILGQLLIGDNHQTTLNGRPVQVRAQSKLDRALLLTTDPNLQAMAAEHPSLKGLLDTVYLQRTWGDCYGYLLLATGRADIMIDPILETWDLLPLVPVVRGAGALITDWKGNAPRIDNVTAAVAAHPDLHPQLLAALAGIPSLKE